MRAHRRGQAGRAARRVVAVDHQVLDADEPGDVHGLLVPRVLEDRVDVPHRQTGVSDRSARSSHGKRLPVNAFISENLRVSDTHDG